MNPTTQQRVQAGAGSIVVMVAGDCNTVTIHDPAALRATTHERYLAGYTYADADLDRRLLIPYFQGIPFHEGARRRDLDMLDGWLDGEARVSIRTLIGTAGTGKTRLAIEFLNRQLPKRTGWDLGWLRTEELRRFTEHNALDQCSWAKDTCIVVDYASAAVEPLRKLLRDSLAAASNVRGTKKLRLLLLDRTPDGWYESLKSNYGDQTGAIGALFASEPADPHRVSRFALEDRRAVLQSAIDGFCQDGAGKPAVPPTGADAVFDRRLADPSQPWADPLFLIIAAAASVDIGLGAALAMSRTDLARFAVRHERSRMDRILNREDCRTKNPLHHMAGLVTLAGSAPLHAVRTVANQERLRMGWPVGFHELEPGLRISLVEEPDGFRGLQPDIVGEAFVLEVLQDLGRDAEEVQEYLKAARALNARGAGQGLVKTLQNFALGAGAVNTAQPGTDAHAETERRLREQGTLVALIGSYIGSCGPGELDVLWAIHDAIPLGSTLLRKLRMDLLGRIGSLVQPDDLGQWLRLLDACVIALGLIGKSRDALAAGRKAVEIRRRLAAAQPDAFLPNLAASLNNLANWLGDVGQRDEALAAIREAVEIYRRLAAAQPDAFRSRLATSLNNLANMLSAVGQRAEALAAIHQAAEIYRQLAAAQPDAFLPDLARSLNNLAKMLSEVGQRDEALAAIHEAAQVYRQLAAAQPDAFLPDLAMSLNNLAATLSDVGQRDDALAAIREAVEIRRQLAAAQPGSFLPDLAMSLHNLAKMLSEVAQRDEALTAIREAVGVLRQLAATQPDAFLPNLAMSLNSLANRLSDVGQHDDALAAIREAVGIYRQLAAAQPDAFRPDLAMSLNNLANRLRDVGQRGDALAPIREAVEIYRQLAAVQPSAFLSDLATSLNNLATMLSDPGQRDEALAAVREAVGIRRQLAAVQPDAFLPNLAGSLNNLAIRLSGVGQRDDALAAIREAVGIYRRLAAAQPDAFLPDLARSLGLFGSILAEAQEWEESIASAAESVALLLPFALKHPEAFGPLFGASFQVWHRASRAAGHAVSEDPKEALRQLLASLTKK